MTTEILETGSEPEPLVTGSAFTITAPHQLGVVLFSSLAGGQVSVPVDASGFGVVPGVTVAPTALGLYRVEGSAILQTQDGVTTTLDVGFSTSSTAHTWPLPPAAGAYPMTGTLQVATPGGKAQSFALGWLNVTASPTPIFLWIHVIPNTAPFTLQGGAEDLAAADVEPLAVGSAWGKLSTWLTAELVEGPPIAGGP